MRLGCSGLVLGVAVLIARAWEDDAGRSQPYLVGEIDVDITDGSVTLEVGQQDE